MNPSDPDALLQLYQRHAQHHRHTPLLDLEAAEAFIAGAGNRVLLFADEPRLVPESWDLAVVLPDALATHGDTVQVGLLLPAVAKRLAARYAVGRWPALLFLRDGDYVGTLEGMRDWSVFQRDIPTLLAQPTQRLPGLGIPVVSTTNTSCH